MKSIILLAPPAAGKGTQSKLLCEKYGLFHISTGDLIREAVSHEDEMSEYLQAQMNAGKLVSDDIILNLLNSKLQEIQGANGYVLDGFPRNIAQAKEYDQLLETIHEQISNVIYLSIPYEEAKNRIVGRISCPKCGRVYHELISENKPQQEGICDDCHIQLVKREDDDEQTFEKRFETYQKETRPLIEYYQEKNILSEIDSTLSTNQVFKMIESIVKL